MGRYVPPDQEGVISGNKLNRKHALGARASKVASQGILTVRFEMPFGVWCSSCPKPTLIGQGVRFNAEKKKVGAYHSSPIYSFRMRHSACGGWIEIRTDPAHTAYVVTEGGKRRDTGDEGAGESLVGGTYEIQTAAERERARASAFSTLEKTIEDRERLIEARQRIGELEDASARQWDDPYAQNRRLRAAFRIGRQERERSAAATEDLKDRMSLGIDLVEASDDDARRAALIDFGGQSTAGDTSDVALAKPLFASPEPPSRAPASAVAVSTSKRDSKVPKLRSELTRSKTREALASEVATKTRKAMDPFLDSRDRAPTRHSSLIPGLKRKRAEEEFVEESWEKGERGRRREETVSVKASAASLVNYDSD